MPLSWVELLLLILAVYRLSRIVTKEDGPFSIFETLRYVTREHWVGELLECPLCFSVWASGLCVLLSLHPLGWWVILWLGVSGGAVLVHKVAKDVPNQNHKT